MHDNTFIIPVGLRSRLAKISFPFETIITQEMDHENKVAGAFLFLS